MNKTSVPSIDSIERQWYLVDAENQTLGRLATEVASVLRGKNKASYTPHLDTGDFVVVVNADKVRVSGNKSQQKLYRRHSGRPGGMKVETFAHLQERLPERIVEKAIKGMLPLNAGINGPLLRKLPNSLELEGRRVSSIFSPVRSSSGPTTLPSSAASGGT